MAISASTVTTTDTLETFRVEFNNLVADVTSIQQVGASNIVISDGGNIGSASDQDAISIAANGVVTFSQAPSFTTGLLVSDLDIDGATDISAAIVDADLFIIDDGASGTNRKTAASRIKTYIADVTLTTAAQTNITSVGTLTALDVDNININGNTITASSGAVNITPASGSAIVLDGAVNIDAGVVTGITSLTSNAILIADAGTIGSASSTSAITIASTGIVTFVDDIIIKDAGTIGSASDTDAISISSGGVVNISATTANTNASDGALTVAGGVGIALDASIGDDLRLISDSAILSFGANSEITVTHVHDVGLTITNTIADTDNRPTILQLKSEEDAIVADDVIASIEMAAGDSDGTDGAVVAAGIHAIAEGTFAADANATKLVFTTGVSETAAASATAKMTLSSAGLLTIADDFVIKDGGTIGSASDTNAITIASNGQTTFSQKIFGTQAEFSSILKIGGYLWLSDDDDFIFFGASAEISIQHDHNVGLIFKNGLSNDNKPFVLQLKSEENEIVADEVIASIEMAAGDSSGTDASTVAAGIHAIAEGEFTSTANPTKLVFTTGTDGSASRADTPKMTLSSAGLLTIADDFVIKDGGTIGSASDTDAIAIASDGVVTMNQIPVFSAGINVSGGNIAGTLSTAAQTNITSVGTLTALTVDDVAINGKVITMTGSSSDTAVFTVGTNGTLSIVTTDDSAAAANIQITADGTAELAGTTVTLDSGGDIVLDADGADVIFKDGGTTILSFTNSSSDAVITSGVQDKDIIFKGDDGGSAITALTLDMSAAGAATFNGAITGGGLLTTGGNIVIPDAGNIGSASDTDAIAIASDGVVTFSQAPVFPDGSINIADIDLDGGTDIGAAIVDADLFLIDDGAGGTMRKTAASRLKTYIGAGALDDITAGDSAVTLATTSGNITIDAQANNSDIILKGTDGGSDTTFLTIDGSAAGKATFNDEIVSGAVITSGAGLVIADAGNIGSASDTDAIAIAANGTVTFSQAVSGTSADFDGGVTIDNITIDGTEIDLSSGDLTLDVAGDIILNADGADIKLADASVTFGHLSNSSSDFVIEAKVQDKDIIFKGDDGGSGITALTLDMSAAGAATFNGAITGGGLLTTGGNIVIPDDGNIGSASDTDSIAIAADGVVTMNQIPVFSAGINVSGGSIAGTLSTAAQTNITSVGTLTALTVDDVAINGKVITMTGSSSDTAVFTAGTNGTLSIVTTDAAAAAANITITADGTFEADGTTITLDSGGDIVLDADGADVIFKDAGTTILSFTNSSSDAVITSGVQDKDIIFKGDDGGSAITALTLDMSAAGAASFNSTITCTPTATLLIKNSSGSTLKTIHGVNSS